MSMTDFAFPLHTLVQACQTRHVDDIPTSVPTISTDTRTITQGALFVALRGERFDGHRFVANAHAEGAAVALVDADAEAKVREAAPELPLIVVDDTLRAFGQMGHAHRQAMGAKVIGVAGSNGKTTTKELIAALVSQVGHTLKTEANHNNWVGVPQTLLKLRPEHRFAVVELGTNAPGELAWLTTLADPDVGVLTNIQAEHLEGFGDLAGVLKEETRLFAGMREDAWRIVPVDEALLANHESLTHGQQRGFGRVDTAHVRLLESISLGLDGQRLHLNLDGVPWTLRVPLLGPHNAINVAAAVACAERFGLDQETCQQGLDQVKAVKQRIDPVEMAGRLIINDAYNANPGSMRAALNALSSLPAQRWVAVLGDMRELGAHSAEAHASLGREAISSVDALFAFGEEAQAMADAARQSDPQRPVAQGDRPELAARFIAAHSAPGDGVLIKGSRGVRLERVLPYLKALLGG